ncbi:sizzled [Latimeria chalumnae]|nr:PREDICTED: secreted frizzled-related protein 2-like [Latimeria chalumnae]|eukprot:XP_005994312.1 PREDICTED: secreted frizzled-related protein 2-like [Latimeria chalumnae]
MFSATPVFFGLCSLLGLVQGFDIGLSTKCVAIPRELDMCHDVGYSEMRLPNLLRDTSMEEVLRKAGQWQQLLQTGCHPQARLFLCSLFAPVCLDTFLHPCRSMCVAVRDSCAPVVACHGQSWPEMLNCDRFPADEDMCLASISEELELYFKAWPRPTCQGCPALEEPYLYKRVLEAFCDNNFAVKVKLTKRRTNFGDHDYKVEGRVEFIHQGALLLYNTRNLIQQWLHINENCAQRMIHTNRPTHYVIAGEIQDGRVVVHRVFHWHKKDAYLILATRKWRHHKC